MEINSFLPWQKNSRQKRLAIAADGNSTAICGSIASIRRLWGHCPRNFLDLIFYHRILKCHVLVELKLEEFSHENIGQLNTYVSWYQKNMRAEADTPLWGSCSVRRKTMPWWNMPWLECPMISSSPSISSNCRRRMK
jgi:hypothetical protein